MSAITGNYRPATPHLGKLVLDWMHCGNDRWTSARHHLAVQLMSIKRCYGRQEASEFRNYLLWIGCYPSRVRI